MSEELARRVETIEQRLARIEARLGLSALPTVGEEPQSRFDELPLASLAAPPPQAPFQPLAAAAQPPLPVQPPPLPAMRPLVYAPKEAPKPVAQSNLEQAIGLKWAGWIGAVVVVIAAALGIQYAYEEGYFGGLPASARLVMLAFCGLALIGAGEYVLRRINQVSAAALFGAGVAVLFLTSYAGHGYFDLYTRTTAFSLMVVSTLLGAAVAMRGRLVSIAVLSLIGGNIAPLILGGDVEDLTPFLAYLLMLQVIALFLAWWGRGGRWRTLRGLAFATTALWTLPMLEAPQQGALLAFCLIAAGLYQVELILSATRAGPESPNATGSGFSMVVSFLLVAGLLFLHRDASEVVRVAWVIGLAGLLAALGLVLLRLPWLSVSYRIQAAVLLVVAVPVYFAEIGIVIGWSALAIGFALLGSRLNLSISRRAAMATWLLSVFYLLMQSLETHDGRGVARPILELWGTPVPMLLPLAVTASLVGHVIAWLVNRRLSDQRLAGEMKTSGQAMGLVSAAVWIGGSLLALPPLGATLMIVAYAWVLAGLHAVQPRPLLAGQVVAVLLLAMVKWATVDMIGHRISPQWSPSEYLPVVNPTMAMGALIAASVAAMGWLLRRELLRLARQDEGQSLVFPVACTVIAIMTLGLTLEIDRMVERAAGTLAWTSTQAKFLAWTMLWSLAVLLVGAIGVRGPDLQRGNRRLAVLAVLLVLISLKYVLADTVLFRLFQAPRVLAVVANLQAAAGLTLFATFMGMILLARAHRLTARGATVVLGCTGGLVLLWAGSMEIDRAAFWLAARGTIARAGLASQMALSVFWAIFAVASVVIGFNLRLAGVRYFGLALFGITLLKVVLIDLSHIGQGYRIISFLGVGLLLLGTSVLYGKLSPRLLAGGKPPADTSEP